MTILEHALIDSEGEIAGSISVKAIALDPAQSADELSEELLDHMLDCPTCLNSSEKSCAVWRNLNARIQAAGGPTRGLAFAY